MPSALGWAAHPFVTDDAGTQGAGRWQLELMAQRDRHDALAPGQLPRRERSVLVNPVLTYGLLDALDIAVGAGYLRNRVSEGGAPAVRADGAGDSTLELKWRFYERAGASVAVKPGLTLPTGEEARDLGSGRAYWGLTLIAAREAAPWAVFGNVAYTRPRYAAADATGLRRDLWRVSAGATRQAGGKVRLAAEIGARTPEARDDPFRPGRHARFAMAGAIYSPAAEIDIDVGLRKGLNDAEADATLLLGATLRW